MQIENLIFIYGAICLSMIVFNTAYNLSLKRKNVRFDRRSKKWEQRILQQLTAVSETGKITPKHYIRLTRRLRYVYQLIAFSTALMRLSETDDPERKALVDAYFLQIQPAVSYLAVVYLKKETMQAAYYAHFLRVQFADQSRTPILSLTNVLLEYVKKPNLYCRINALKAR